VVKNIECLINSNSVQHKRQDDDISWLIEVVKVTKDITINALIQYMVVHELRNTELRHLRDGVTIVFNFTRAYCWCSSLLKLYKVFQVLKRMFPHQNKKDITIIDPPLCIRGFAGCLCMSKRWKFIYSTKQGDERIHPQISETSHYYRTSVLQQVLGYPPLREKPVDMSEEIAFV